MRVKGVLIEGNDGHEYLLGFSPTQLNRAPILSRRQPDGTFEPLRDMAEVSTVAMTQLDLTSPHLRGPGIGKDLLLWGAFQEALRAFPPLPTWPALPDEP
jgi:hypothetical protein